MSVKGSIKEQIEKLELGEMVASRQVLHHGRRGSVDTAMSTLFKEGFIFRVAQGIYIRGDEHTPRPSADQIARFKSSVFRKEVAPIDIEFARALSFEVDPAIENGLFATTGRSGRIWTIDGFVHFTGSSLRKIVLSESKIGTELRTIWHMGCGEPTESTMQHVIREWTEMSWDEANSRMAELPQWLAEHTLKLPRAGPNQLALSPQMMQH